MASCQLAGAITLIRLYLRVRKVNNMSELILESVIQKRYDIYDKAAKPIVSHLKKVYGEAPQTFSQGGISRMGGKDDYLHFVNSDLTMNNEGRNQYRAGDHLPVSHLAFVHKERFPEDKTVHVYDHKTNKITAHPLTDKEAEPILEKIKHPGVLNSFNHLPKRIQESTSSLPISKADELHRHLWNSAQPSTDDAEEAVNKYTEAPGHNDTSSSRAINKGLIETSNPQQLPQKMKDNINSIKTHISKQLPLDKGMSVFSGTGSWDPTRETKGKILHNKAFISSSVNFAKAQEFSEGNIAHFKLPVGYKNGAYVANNSNHPEEKEYLLNSDQKWKHIATKATSTGKVHTFEPLD